MVNALNSDIQNPSLLDELNKERVKFNIEIIKLLTLLFLTTGGAGLALLIEEPGSIAKDILGYAGVCFSAGSGMLALVTYKNTLRKLK